MGDGLFAMSDGSVDVVAAYAKEEASTAAHTDVLVHRKGSVNVVK